MTGESGESEERGVRLPAAILLALLPLVVAAGWLALTRWTSPSDGTVTLRASQSWRGGSLLVDAVYAPGSPLRPGDRLTAADGVPVARLVTGGGLTVHSGQVLTYRVDRAGPDGALRQVDLPVRLGRYPVAEGLGEALGILPVVVIMYAVATFVLIRRPRQPATRALYAIAVLLPFSATTFPLGPQLVESVSGRLWPFVVGDVVNCVIWGALLHFALTFPQQPAALRRRPWLVVVPYLVPFALHAVRMVVLLAGGSDPLALRGDLIRVSLTAASVQPVLVGAAMVANYRASDPDDLARRRMRWAFSAFAVSAACYLLLGQLPTRVWGGPLLRWDLLALLFVPFPVALGIAVLRYRLFDIQVILRRSLVLGAVTIGLAASYLVVVAAATRWVRLPQGVAPFVASVAVALLFDPLRTQARRLVSRALFGDRDDPVEVMSRLGERLEATGSADSVLATLVETLADTLRLSYAAITLHGADGAQDATARYGVAGTASRALRLPVTHAGEQVGLLEIDAGPGREPFGVADRRLLDALARQLGVISQNLLLESRLRQSLERAVVVREEERRRLRRDLHDGLGPALASAGFRSELAASLVDADPARAKDILAGLGGACREAVADLRRLLDGLRPPVLDRLGLVGAVRERAAGFPAGALRVDVQAADGIEPLPAAVEVAAFHIVQEALTNVVKHARAGRCTVRLSRDPSALLVEVADDGCGLPAGYRTGVGLTAIRERAVEVGGSASVTPGPDGGTLVRARLPVRPPS